MTYEINRQLIQLLYGRAEEVGPADMNKSSQKRILQAKCRRRKRRWRWRKERGVQMGRSSG